MLIKTDYDVYTFVAHATIDNTTSSFTRDGVKIASLPQGNKLLKVFKELRFWLAIDKSRIDFLNFLRFKRRSECSVELIVYNKF